MTDRRISVVKKYLTYFVCSLIICILTGCSNQSKEEVFCKTIYDFEGYQVENLDEQVDSNFLVYEEGVQELIIDNNSNCLVFMDEENFIYEFSNASDEIKKMKKGDVFWASIPERPYEPIAVKVDTLNVDGNRVIIHGAELYMEDLYVYVDLDMDIPASAIQVDPSTIDQESTLEWITQNTASNDNQTIDTMNLSYTDNQESKLQKKINVEGPIGLVSTWNIDLHSPSLHKDMVGLTLKGTFRVGLKSTRVTYCYDKSSGYWYGGTTSTEYFESDLDFGGEGDLGSIRKSLFTGIVPTGAPLIYGEITPYAVLEANGSITGGFTSKLERTVGFMVSGKGTKNISYDSIESKEEPVNTYHLTEYNATVTAGLDFNTTLNVTMVAKITGGAVGGLELKGSYDPLEGSIVENEDFVHDCKVCIDGAVYPFARVYVGINLGVEGHYLYEAVATIMELRWEALNGFYISFGRDGLGKPEFGEGECPHKRYRTNITVLDMAGNYAGGAAIDASYADGRTDSVIADNHGEAVMYLPSGDNLLTANGEGQTGKAHAVISEEPVDVIIQMKEKRNIFVLFDYDSNFSENEYQLNYIREIVQENYPEAFLLDASIWGISGGFTTGSHIGYHIISQMMTVSEDQDVSVGDIVILVSVKLPDLTIYKKPEIGYEFTTSSVTNSIGITNTYTFEQPLYSDQIFPYNVYINIGMLVIDEHALAYSHTNEDVTRWAWMYSIDSNTGYIKEDIEPSKEDPYYYITNMWQEVDEDISGTIYNTKYCINKNLEIKGIDSYSKNVWEGHMRLSDYITSLSGNHYKIMFQECFEKVCAVTEALLANEWEKYLINYCNN